MSSPAFVDSNSGAGATGNSGGEGSVCVEDSGVASEICGGESLAVCVEDGLVEPHEGMEFDSEEAAKVFYDNYAYRVGFVMRVMNCRRSAKDKKILARRLGCNKEGYREIRRAKHEKARKPRAITREGCKAMIHVKYDKSGKWIITKFIREHSHPLVVTPRVARQAPDDKDKEVQELTSEIRSKKRLCAAYQEQLVAFMRIVEEHNNQLSRTVRSVVDNIKQYESLDEEFVKYIPANL